MALFELAAQGSRRFNQLSDLTSTAGSSLDCPFHFDYQALDLRSNRLEALAGPAGCLLLPEY